LDGDAITDGMLDAVACIVPPPVPTGETTVGLNILKGCTKNNKTSSSTIRVIAKIATIAALEPPSCSA